MYEGKEVAVKLLKVDSVSELTTKKADPQELLFELSLMGYFDWPTDVAGVSSTAGS